MPQPLTTEEFIRRSRYMYGDRYHYTKTVYKGYFYPVTITCPRHGDFKVRPSNHLSRTAASACKDCGRNGKPMDRRGISENDMQMLWLQRKCGEFTRQADETRTDRAELIRKFVTLYRDEFLKRS